MRGLHHDGGPITPAGYATVLADSCCESFELRYLVGGNLIGVAIVDRGEQSLSAVYCYYDPVYGGAQPGRVLDPLSDRAVPPLGPLASLPRPDDRGLQGDGVQAQLLAARAAARRSLAARRELTHNRRPCAGEVCRVERLVGSRWPGALLCASPASAERFKDTLKERVREGVERSKDDKPRSRSASDRNRSRNRNRDRSRNGNRTGTGTGAGPGTRAGPGTGSAHPHPRRESPHRSQRRGRLSRLDSAAVRRASMSSSGATSPGTST